MAKKLKENYEKVLLSAALIVTLSIGTMVCVQAGKLGDTFAREPGPGHPIPELPSVDGDPYVPDPETGAALRERIRTPDGRPVDTFTAVSLFLDKRDGNIIDLLAAGSRPIHPPIPNDWWPANGIDPRFADSLQRDPDRDGFTNLDEFRHQTDPTDARSHGPLIGKLTVVALESESILLSFKTTTAHGEPRAEDSHGFVYQDSSHRQNRTAGVKAGRGKDAMIFTKGPGAARFELAEVRLIQRLNPRTKIMKPVYVAEIIDRSPAKNGRRHDLEKGPGKGLRIHDFTVTLALHALGQSGERVHIAEGGTFHLPFDATDSADYTFKEVTADGGVVIEWQDGDDKLQTVLAVE